MIDRKDVEHVARLALSEPELERMREDEVGPCLPQDAALANAPDPSGEFFRAPRIIEE
jgi:aspartyl/glutamyl-tRNA(Asn/Gln) amidotransferase C subunit